MQWRTLHPPQRGEADQGSGVRKRAASRLCTASRLCAAGTGVHKQPGDSTSSSLSSLLVSWASPRVPENLRCKPAALPVCAPPSPLLFDTKFVVAVVVDLPPRSSSLGPVSVPQKGPKKPTTTPQCPRVCGRQRQLRTGNLLLTLDSARSRAQFQFHCDKQ